MQCNVLVSDDSMYVKLTCQVSQLKLVMSLTFRSDQVLQLVLDR